MTRRRAPDPDAGGREDASRPLGPRAQWLVDEANAIDREARFRERFAEVREGRRRRRLRDRAVTTTAAVGAAGTAVLVGAVVAGWTGTAVAVVLAVVVAGVWRLLARRAEARGASAWDWCAERHRLLGDPSREVQALDRPEGRR